MTRFLAFLMLAVPFTTPSQIKYKQNGTGSLTRFAGDRLGDFVSVRDFCLTVDGTTDNTTCIQNALNAHKEIYFPENADGTAATYIINGDSAFTGGGKDCVDGGIAPQSNARIWISPNATLKAKTNSTGNYCVLRLQGVDNVYIYGGTIQGERATHIGSTGEYGYGIGVVGSTNVYIYNVVVKDFWGDGLVLDMKRTPDVLSDNVVISNIVVTNNRRNGLSVISATDVLISNSIFQTSNGTAPQAGIDIEPGVSGNTTKRIKVEGCIIENNTKSGIQVQGLNGGTNLGDITLANNTLLSNGYRGISLYQAQSGGVNIVGNTARGSTDSGISAEWSSDVLISGNRSDANTVHGINIIGPVSNITVTGNEVSSNTQHGIFVGGTVDGNPTQTAIISNTSTLNVLDGIRVLNLTDGTISYNTVLGNSQGTDNTNHGILLSTGVSGVLVEGNIIRQGTGAKRQAYGLNMNSVTNTYIIGNDLITSGLSGDVLNFTPVSATFAGNRWTAGQQSQDRLPLAGLVVALTAQVANLAATNVYAVAPVGEYRVCATARTTTSGTGTTATLNIIWTDEGGVKTDLVGTWALNSVTVTGQINKCEYIHAANGTNIQVSVTAGTYGTSVYAISATAERLN